MPYFFMACALVCFLICMGFGLEFILRVICGAWAVSVSMFLISAVAFAMGRVFIHLIGGSL